MRFSGYAAFILMASAAAAEHAAYHERLDAHWRNEWVDDDYDPNYRHWYEKQVPPMERWKPPK